MNGFEYIIFASIFAVGFWMSGEILGMIAEYINNKNKQHNNANQR